MNFFKTSLVALAISSASAAWTCNPSDYVTPIKGSDGVNAVIAAGPTFVTPSDSSLISSSTDKLALIFRNPMVVNATHNTWTRQLKFFLVASNVSAPTDQSSFNTAYTAAGSNCKFTQAADVALSTLDGLSSTSGQSTCQPTFTYAPTWEQIRDATNGCGLIEDLTDSTNFIYTGNVHVMWVDSDGAGYTRPAALTYYPVTVKFQKSIEQTDNTLQSNNTNPYVADSFQVTGVSYTKSGSNVVLKVAYQVSTYWPYFPMPNRNGAALSGGLPVSAQALTVPYSYGGSYAIPTAFSSTTGCATTPGAGGADRPDSGICTFTQEVSYTWAFAGNCDAGSADAFKINLATCVYSSTNGASNQGCLDVDLKDSNGDSVGSFNINTGIDLCAAPANTYTLTASSPFAPSVATVDVGKQVSLGTTITSSGKKMTSVVVWDAHATDATKGTTYTFATGGVADSFTSAISLTHNADTCLAVNKLSCTFTMSYTPNVGATDADNYMIILSDRSRTVAFSNYLKLRVYWDSVNSAGGAGLRRLMYRDQVISSISQAGDISQVATQNIRVPSNLAATEGATMQSVSSGLSVGAIAGIAVGCVAVIAASAGVAAVVIRKRRVQVEDAEKATPSKY